MVTRIAPANSHRLKVAMRRRLVQVAMRQLLSEEVAKDSEAVEECARRNVVETFSFLHFLYDSRDEFCYEESLEKFNAEVYGEFAEGRDKKEAEKAERLAPYIEAALARRRTRPALADSQIDIVPASRPKNMAAG